MAQRRSKRHHHAMSDELDFTPLISVLIIIIFFLLLTAVFAKIAIIDIYLPQEGQGSETAEQNAPSVGVLAIKITEDGFELGGIGGGVLIPKNSQGLNFNELTNQLIAIKDKYPRKEDVILLFDKDISYDTVVKVMDASREITDGTRRILFPLVSLGENR